MTKRFGFLLVGFAAAWSFGACGGSEGSTNPEASDAGDGGRSSSSSSASSSSGSIDDAGADADADAPPDPNALVTTPSTVLGITTGPSPHVVYTVAGSGPDLVDVRAVPVAGGASVLVRAAVPTGPTMAKIAGGAVAVFSPGPAPAENVTIWTAQNGAKTVVTPTRHYFWANEDGSSVAVVKDHGATLDIVVTTSAAPSLSATGFTGVHQSGWAGLVCEPKVLFRGASAFGAYCRGTNRQARVERITSGGAPFVVVDHENPPSVGPVNPYAFEADATGTKLFLRLTDNTAYDEGVIAVIDGDTVTFAFLDTRIGAWSVLPNQSALVYRTSNNGNVKRVTMTIPPESTTVGVVSRVTHISNDSKRAIVAMLLPTNEGNLDVRGIDLELGGEQIVHVPTRVARIGGFTGSSTHVIAINPFVAGKGGPLTAFPVAGGEGKVLMPSALDVLVAPAGTNMLAVTREAKLDAYTNSLDLALVDALGGPPKPVAANVRYKATGYYPWSGNTFVWQSVDQPVKPGIFVIRVP